MKRPGRHRSSAPSQLSVEGLLPAALSPGPVGSWMARSTTRAELLVGAVSVVLAVLLTVALGANAALLTVVIAAVWLSAAGLRSVTPPRIIAVLIVCVMSVSTGFYRLPSGLPFDLEPYRLVLILLFMTWVMALLAVPGTTVRRTPIDGRLALLALALVLSTAVNVLAFDPGEWGISVKALFYYAGFLALFYAIVSTCRSREACRRLVLVLVAWTVVVSLFGFVERYTGFNVFRQLHTFIPILEVTSSRIYEEMLRGGVRIAGPASHPIEFGTMLAMVFPFAVVQLVDARSSRSRTRWGLVATAIIFAMFLTVSRTAIIGMFVCLIVLAVLRPGPARCSLSCCSRVP